MGSRGPAKKPTALRILHGDEERRINRNEPQPLDEVPEPPMALEGEYLEVWNHTVRHLAGMGLAKSADRSALLAYVLASVEMFRSARLVMQSGPLLKDAHGVVRRNPALIVLNNQQSQVRVFAREFGLTPAARVAFTAPGEHGEEDRTAQYFTA